VEPALKVDPPGLQAAARRLRDAAAQLNTVEAAVHPPLACDQTSAAAAQVFTAAAVSLRSHSVEHAAALLGTADQLAAICAGFSQQESLNASAVRNLISAQPVSLAGLADPVPPAPEAVVPDLLPPGGAITGEALARQLHAGSSSAGAGFIGSCRAARSAAMAAADIIRDLLLVLPEQWSSRAGVEATATRLERHTIAVSLVAAHAAALADQADSHARAYADAVARTPPPEAFAAVRAQLASAQRANAAFPGRYAPLVSSLIGQHGALQHEALNARDRYHEETAEAMSPEQSGQLASQLPAMVPAMLGALGGLAGGAVAAAAQIPQALMQGGQQLVQAAAHGMSGAAPPHSNGNSTAPSESDRSRLSPAGDRHGVAGPTAPAGATAGAPLLTSPPPAATTPRGAVDAAPAAVASAYPTATVMPPGMMAHPSPGDAQPQVPADKTILVPPVPNTESVTGRAATGRLAVATHRPVDNGTS
jgi:hypothetical protein